MTYRTSFVVRNYINALSPPGYPQNKTMSPVPVPSPPRYDFGHAGGGGINNSDHQSSDDSNGMAVQNLSLNKHDLQLDLSIYKSHYKLDLSGFQPRKEFRMLKFENEGVDKKYGNIMEKSLEDSINQDLDIEAGLKDKNDDGERGKYSDDLSNEDMRSKSFDLHGRVVQVSEEIIRTRYEPLFFSLIPWIWT